VRLVKNLANALARELSACVENVIYLNRIDSTHQLALRIMDQMEAQDLELVPTVVIAGQQSHGRGRGDRRWESPAGGLYVNWARSGLAPETLHRLPMLAAAAAHRAIAATGVAEAGIKWPNDIVVNGRKLAGILIHGRSGARVWATVGLGVNIGLSCEVNHHLEPRAVALADLVRPVPFEEWYVEITGDFITSLTEFLGNSDAAHDLWSRKLIHEVGEALSVRLGDGTTVTGTYLGLTAEGFLRLRTDAAERRITTGDIFEAE
jgi:BirA family biotin operon repressor/biotin-[acetyl-CoA-carboxylase] ligase